MASKHGWITHDYSSTITTTIPAGKGTVTVTGDVSPQLNFNTDKTPADPFEEAELKLAGVCPACRREDGIHDWDCKHYNYSTSTITGAGITFNSNYQPGFTLDVDTEISIGQATLDEAKIKKLDKLLDLFDDEELDKLILDKLTKKVDKE